MLTLAERKQLHLDFWAGKLKQPLLGVFMPFASGYPGMDIDLTVDDIGNVTAPEKMLN